MRLFNVTVTAGVLLLSGASTSGAEQPGTISTFTVDPQSTPMVSDVERLSRTTPYIAIYEVNPPPETCYSAHCWPSVGFFVFNPRSSGGQDVTVECSAFTRDGSLLSRGSETPQLLASDAGISNVVFRGADYGRFAKVVCRVIGASPNALGRR